MARPAGGALLSGDRETGVPLSVLMVIAGYPPAVGGGERNCEKLARALVRRGLRVEVVTRAIAGPPRVELRDGVRIRWARRWPGRGAASRIASALSFLVAVAGAAREARAGRFDVVHVHGLDLPLALLRLVGVGRTPVQATPLCAGPDGEGQVLARSRAKAPVRWGLGRVDRFQILSPIIAEELAALGIDRERMVELPYGVEIRHAGDEAAEPDAGVVLFGGRLAPQKCPDALVEAWGRVRARERGARLVLSGDGPLAGELARLRLSLGLEATVELPGFLPDYLERLDRATLFVLPSRSEGMSNAILEAMAAGVPCVVSDLPENRFLLGEAGVYVPVGDVDALAAALDRVLGSDEERARLARAVRERAALHDIATIAERQIGIYEQLRSESSS